MRTPWSLRIARLLLVGAATAAVGVASYITQASGDPLGAAPILSLFIILAVVFVGAALRLERDPANAKLLALAGALGLGGLGVLTGWGAGNVSFPSAALGILAAWAAALHPPRRLVVIAFLAYAGVGLALILPRLGFALAYPWQLANVLLWPFLALLVSPALAGFPIFVSIGASLALVAVLVARRRWPIAHPAPPIVALAVVGCGALAVALHTAHALARPHTSARFELEALPLAILFAAGAALGLGLASIRARPALATSAFALGAGIALYVVLSSPTVECRVGGMTTRSAPWWLPSTGPVSSVGDGSGDRSSGQIRSGDVVVRYACVGARVTEFRIDRAR